jgi:hypothetical protein
MKCIVFENLHTFTCVVATNGKMVVLSNKVTNAHAICLLTLVSGCCCHLGEQT